MPWCLLHSPVHFGQCEDRLRRALRIDPDAPFVTFFLEQPAGGCGAVTRSRSNWPGWRSPTIATNCGRSPACCGPWKRLDFRPRRTGFQARRLRWWPDHPGLIVNRVVGLTERGDLAAIDRLDAQLGPKTFPQWMAVPEGLNAAAAGQHLARAAARLAPGPIPNSMQPVYCMLVLAQIGDLDAAYALADPLYPRLRGRNLAEEDRYWLDSMDKPQLALLSSPAAAALRRDPRFLAIADRVRPSRLIGAAAASRISARPSTNRLRDRSSRKRAAARRCHPVARPSIHRKKCVNHHLPACVSIPVEAQ